LSALGKLDNTVILFFSDNTTLGGKGTCSLAQGTSR
jgi:arylsulfatase A-like enzyme